MASRKQLLHNFIFWKRLSFHQKIMNINPLITMKSLTKPCRSTAQINSLHIIWGDMYSQFPHMAALLLLLCAESTVPVVIKCNYFRLLRARQRTNSAPVNAYERRRELNRRKYMYLQSIGWQLCQCFSLFVWFYFFVHSKCEVSNLLPLVLVPLQNQRKVLFYPDCYSEFCI